MAQPMPLVRIRPGCATIRRSRSINGSAAMPDSYFWSPDQTVQLRRARRIDSIIPNENISFSSIRQQPMPMREHGIASPGEQAAAVPGESLLSLSEICPVLVTLRETQVLRSGTTIPLASKVPASADWVRQMGRAHHRPGSTAPVARGGCGRSDCSLVVTARRAV